MQLIVKELLEIADMPASTEMHERRTKSMNKRHIAKMCSLGRKCANYKRNSDTRIPKSNLWTRSRLSYCQLLHLDIVTWNTDQ